MDDTDHRGDGTVFRSAAAPPGVDPAYLPQTHGALSKTNEAIEYVAAKLTERPFEAFLADTAVGIRVPEVVGVDQPFLVELLDGRPGLLCAITDIEQNQPQKLVPSKLRGGLVGAEFTAPRPGLYRISISGGGYSPVEALVCAMDQG